MNIVEELENHQTVLVLMPGIEYKKVVTETAKQLKGKKICYITMNRTYDALKDLLKKNKISSEDITVIDIVTKLIKANPKKQKNVYFYNSLEFQEVFEQIKKLLNQKFDYLIFDSLTNFFSYKKTQDVDQYIFTLINYIRQTKTKAVLYALDEQETLIPRCCTYVDKTIPIEA